MRYDFAGKPNRKRGSGERDHDPEEKASEINVFRRRGTRPEQDQRARTNDRKYEYLKLSRNRISPHVRQDTGPLIKRKVTQETEEGRVALLPRA